MHVTHGLVGRGAVILQDVEVPGPRGLAHRTAQTRQHSTNGGGGFIRQLVQRFSRLFWDDQSMAVGYGVNVQEGQHVLVFVDLMTRYLAVQYFLKDRHRAQNKPNP